MTKVSMIWNIWDPLVLHLNQNDLITGKKRLSYGQYTKGRLHDSSEYHTGPMGSFRASFEPKISNIGQEIAELWPI